MWENEMYLLVMMLYMDINKQVDAEQHFKTQTEPPPVL